MKGFLQLVALLTVVTWQVASASSVLGQETPVAPAAQSAAGAASPAGEAAAAPEAKATSSEAAAPKTAAAGPGRAAGPRLPRAATWEEVLESSSAQHMSIETVKVKYGVGTRVCAERVSNLDFDKETETPGKDDGYFTATTRVWADIEFNDRLRAFVCGQDVHRWDKEQIDPNDEFDLYMGYVDFDLAILPLTLRVGRQELDYGRGRVLSRSWGSPYGIVWDTAMVTYRDEFVKVDAFAANRVVRVQDDFNNADHFEDMFGAYAQIQAHRVHRQDVYFFARTNQERPVTGEDGHEGTLAVYTLGVRAYGRLGKALSYDVELPVQFGKYARDDIRAWALAVSLEYTLDVPGKLFLGLECDHASGEDDRTDGEHNRFIDACSTNWPRLGTTNLFNWENVTHVGVAVGAKPLEGMKVQLAYRQFWLDEPGDWWKNYGGIPVRLDPTGEADSETGRELALTLCWRPADTWTIVTGYGLFLAGQYLEDTGTHDDASYAYFIVSWGF